MNEEDCEVEEEEKEDTILDNQWIEDFEIMDKEYEKFYTDNIHKITIHCIYVNKNNEIEKIKKETINMKQINYISREEILGILKRNSIDNNKKRYSVMSILKYNIDIEPLDIQFFVTNNNDNTFLTSIKNKNAIPLKKNNKYV